jgi:transposase-like protein
MYQDIDFYQFQKRFMTEQRCIQFLLKRRWKNGFVCPKCQHKDGYFIQTRLLYQCKSCHHQVSVTSGTIFHKTRTPLRKWFWMIYFMTQSKHSYSISGLQRLLNISAYNTAWSMSQKIRHAMSDRDATYKLAGLIEMDDSYFGTRHAEGKRGRGADKKSKVIVSVQLNDDENPIFAAMKVVPKVDGDNIKITATDTVKQGSTIKTDGWPAYNAVKEQGFQHEKVVIGDPKKASELLPWVHTIIANCKGVLRGTHHGVSAKHLQRYLAEFCYRLNRRFDPLKLFDRSITACLSTGTVTVSELMK